MESTGAIRPDSSGILCEIGRGVVEPSRLPAAPADASPRRDRGWRPTAETTGREQCVTPYHWTRHLRPGTNRRTPVGVPVDRSFDADRRATATDPRARSPLLPVIAVPGGVARPNGQSRPSRRSETLPTLFVYQCRLLDTTARRRVGPRGRRAGSTGPWRRRASRRRGPWRADRTYREQVAVGISPPVRFAFPIRHRTRRAGRLTPAPGGRRAARTPASGSAAPAGSAVGRPRRRTPGGPPAR